MENLKKNKNEMKMLFYCSRQSKFEYLSRLKKSGITMYLSELGQVHQIGAFFYTRQTYN